MRVIAFITNGPTVRDILGHLGEPTAPPRIAPARGPPLWAAAAAHDPAADPRLQSAPDFEFDQRIAWQPPTSLDCGRRRAGSCLPPPGCPRAAMLASAPARKYPEKRAEQPVAAANRRLTRPTGSSTPSRVRLR
jgi:hypothetical protein